MSGIISLANITKKSEIFGAQCLLQDNFYSSEDSRFKSSISRESRKRCLFEILKNQLGQCKCANSLRFHLYCRFSESSQGVNFIRWVKSIDSNQSESSNGINCVQISHWNWKKKWTQPLLVPDESSNQFRVAWFC